MQQGVPTQDGSGNKKKRVETSPAFWCNVTHWNRYTQLPVDRVFDNIVTTVVVPLQHCSRRYSTPLIMFDGIYNDLNRENGIYLDRRKDSGSTSVVTAVLICRHMEWSSVVFKDIVALLSLLWSHLLLVTAFHDIYERSVCVLQREPRSFTGPVCGRGAAHAVLCEYQDSWTQPIPDSQWHCMT